MPNASNFSTILRNFWNDLAFEPETALILKQSAAEQASTQTVQETQSTADLISPAPLTEESDSELSEYEAKEDLTPPEFVEEGSQPIEQEFATDEIAAFETQNEAANELANSEAEADSAASRVAIPGLTEFARNVAITEARRFKEAALKKKQQKDPYDY